MVLDTIYWEVSARCNLSCKHCYQGGSKNKKELDLEESLSKVDNFFRNGVTTLLLTGGEPLLNPNIFEIIKRSRDYGIDTAVLTNGTLISKDCASRIADSNPNTIQISLDGLNETHDFIRGAGCFKKIEHAINNLSKAGVYPSMKLTINKYNYPHVYEVVEYCKNNDLILGTSLMQEFGNGMDNRIMINPKEYFDLFLGLYQIKQEVNIKLSLPDFAIEEYITSKSSISACSAARRMASVTIENSFLPCPFMSGLDLNQKQGIQEFSDTSLLDYNNIPLFEVLQKHNEKDFGCPLRKLQYGGFDPYSVYAFIKFQENEAV